MTADEARKIILSDLKIGTKKTADALCLAVDALDKQVQKKVKREKRSKYCGFDPYCPTCDQRLFDSADPYECYEDDYCQNCGQRLDWGD